MNFFKKLRFKIKVILLSATGGIITLVLEIVSRRPWKEAVLLSLLIFLGITAMICSGKMEKAEYE